MANQHLGVLTAPQQPTSGKFRVSSVVGFIMNMVASNMT